MVTLDSASMLTSVIGDAPMGALIRRYWLPVYLSGDLLTNGEIKRIRILGEDLVIFRNEIGRVGILAELCSHRGASLYFGRNENCGLRCVYHGWEYDVEGHCIDMPNEPPFSRFKEKVQHRAYPCVEQGGVVWTYMGPAETLPALPQFEWALVPEENRFVSARVQYSNWLQAVEGGIDSSHSGFLHSPLKPNVEDLPSNSTISDTLNLRFQDKHPRFEAIDTDCGTMIGARRNAGDDWYYWRVSHFLMPFYNMIPPAGPTSRFSCKAWVPIDDENTLNWGFAWHPTEAFSDDERSWYAESLGNQDVRYAPAISQWYGHLRPEGTLENDYFLDREAQRTKVFCGISGVARQDQAMQESSGAIYDRRLEHLGSSDLGVLAARNRIKNAIVSLAENETAPPGVEDGAAYMLRGMHMVIPADKDWVTEFTPVVKAVVGEFDPAPLEQVIAHNDQLA